jgi:putative transposase
MALGALQAAYASVHNLLAPIVVETNCWNRYTLHGLAYRRLRAETPLGSQMCCNVSARRLPIAAAERRDCE